MPNDFVSAGLHALKSPTIVILVRHALGRTCIVRFLKQEFPAWDFLDMASTTELHNAADKHVTLIGLDVAGRSMTDPSLCNDFNIIKYHFPNASLALLSNNEDRLEEMEAMKMGVRGYFTPSLPVEIALAGVRLVLAGGVFFPHSQGAYGNIPSTMALEFSPEADSSVREYITTNKRSQNETINGFTQRESDVLAELQRGHSNKIIAQNLQLSDNTVKMHLQHIMRKLRVQNRTEVVLLVQRRISDNAQNPSPI